jgi:hypothetical protein
MNNSETQYAEAGTSNTHKYEMIKRFIKYILITLIVGLGARYVPDLPMKNDEILIIGLVAGVSFAVIDMMSPSIEIKNLNN